MGKNPQATQVAFEDLEPLLGFHRCCWHLQGSPENLKNVNAVETVNTTVSSRNTHGRRTNNEWCVVPENKPAFLPLLSKVTPLLGSKDVTRWFS